MATELRERLQKELAARVCWVGLGNEDWGDDGLGMQLARQLQADGCPDVVLAGVAPERAVFRVMDAAYDHAVLVDAVDFGGSPGSVIFLEAAEIQARFPQVSTHKLSLGALASLLANNGHTKVWLLGVQPDSLRPAHTLSTAVQTTLDQLRGICDLRFAICDLSSVAHPVSNPVLPASLSPHAPRITDDGSRNTPHRSRLTENEARSTLHAPRSRP